MHAPRVFLRRAVGIASICSHFNIAALQTAAGSMQRSSGRVRMRRVGAVAGRQRPDRRGRLLRGRRGGLDRCSRSRRSSLRHSAVGCRMCVRACASVHTSGGRELRRVRVASRRVGMVDVLWHDFHQSPSRHPEQREQLPQVQPFAASRPLVRRPRGRRWSCCSRSSTLAVDWRLVLHRLLHS